ncbi:hypothetical protein AYI70_g8756 [Smittium culicis]|uniref:Uncharacterized protein n=1 Tax=Smittium culicis TaxID=133412 RepID=A0A1R1XEI8_9FUNG|nr:hypothetical protein AYI70_g8756 [Smittium culicis]
MVDIRPSFQEDIGTIRDTRYRPVRIVDEQEIGTLLQLVPRHQVNRAECANLQLVTFNPVMENGNMVPGSPETISLTTATTTGKNRNTRPEKRKITAIEQKELVSYGVENQRNFLKTQGLSDSTINIIVSNERSLKRRSRYHYTQQNFLEWSLNNNQSSDILPGHVVNYLAHLFTTRKLGVNITKSFKSAILNLVADPRTMENSHCIR